MQELIDKPQLRALMGQVARHEYGTEFAPAVVAHKLLEVIAGLPVREPALQARAAKSSVGSVEDDMTSAVTVAKYPAPVSMRRIVIIHSILARHDALSASVYDTYQILAANPTFQVSVFAHRNDFADVPSVFVRDVADLLLHPDYLAADLIIWHFGVCYSLFDAILMGNGKARKVVVFHNITPKQFVPEWLAPLIDQSFRQAHLLRSADEVWNVSPINAETARAFGVADDRVSVVPLVVDAPANSALAEKSRTPVQMIFVGRIVKIKGVLDLIDAVLRLRRRGVPAFRLRLTGNEFSDPDYVSMVRTAIDDYGLSDDVQWLGTVDDRTLFELYHAAHILAIPSYHEGFCKPVVEGLRAGCIPVGYASYNLPYVANKLGRLVPTGDIAALTDALADILEALGGALAMPMERRLPLDCGLLSVSEFDEAARNYVRNFTRAEVSRTVISRVDKLLDVNPSNRDSAASKNYSSGVGELFGV